MKIKFLMSASLLFAVIQTAPAHETHAQDPNAVIMLARSVVPEVEHDRVQALLADGPAKTSGIGGVNVLGTVSLDSSDGLMMRVRELLIDPGGVVAVHQHDHRSGAAHIIEGEMTEHRSSEKKPVVKKAGDVAMERSGVVHWWKNTGSTRARALVVDIVTTE